MIARRILLFSIAAAACGVATFNAGLAQPYPTKPIKLIVPLAPGGTIDVIARLMAQQLSLRLGQSVSVENRLGAGGMIAIKAVAAADPDGYTLLFGSSGTLAISPALYRNAGSGNLMPVAAAVIVPANLLAAASTVPARSVDEVIALAKANPGKLAHGSTLGSPPHLLGEFFRAKTGIDIRHVPYRGSAQAIPDLLGGRIQLIAESTPILLPYIQQGGVRPFVVAAAARQPELAGVPTLNEHNHSERRADERAPSPLARPAPLPGPVQLRTRYFQMSLRTLPLTSLGISIYDRAPTLNTIGERIPTSARYYTTSLGASKQLL